ncbi:unnamed protein product [Medioppia subpectinata]|uniref:Uncharacterized protein n=1 Tax=Medioppia subpectinata TaxID=1979941 RepID=A0A7R9LUY5_9ACAR|nr:unnamed protein product [Medioppia subpectinata]CAG2121330.1 unnamed protein product [Medioppia subpectinata]
MRSYNSHRGMSDDFPQERHRFETEFGGELAPIESRRFRKRFTDLLKANLLRRNRSKDPTQYNLLLNSMDELMAPQSLETESQ